MNSGRISIEDFVARVQPAACFIDPDSVIQICSNVSVKNSGYDSDNHIKKVLTKPGQAAS